MKVKKKTIYIYIYRARTHDLQGVRQIHKQTCETILYVCLCNFKHIWLYSGKKLLERLPSADWVRFWYWQVLVLSRRMWYVAVGQKYHLSFWYSLTVKCNTQNQAFILRCMFVGCLRVGVWLSKYLLCAYCVLRLTKPHPLDTQTYRT